jgi:hypothetical protein
LRHGGGVAETGGRACARPRTAAGKDSGDGANRTPRPIHSRIAAGVPCHAAGGPAVRPLRRRFTIARRRHGTRRTTTRRGSAEGAELMHKRAWATSCARGVCVCAGDGRTLLHCEVEACATMVICGFNFTELAYWLLPSGASGKKCGALLRLGWQWQVRGLVSVRQNLQALDQEEVEGSSPFGFAVALRGVRHAWCGRSFSSFARSRWWFIYDV